jgi:hypothetical protein
MLLKSSNLKSERDSFYIQSFYKKQKYKGANSHILEELFKNTIIKNSELTFGDSCILQLKFDIFGLYYSLRTAFDCFSSDVITTIISIHDSELQRDEKIATPFLVSWSDSGYRIFRELEKSPIFKKYNEIDCVTYFSTLPLLYIMSNDIDKNGGCFFICDNTFNDYIDHFKILKRIN